MQLVIPVQVVSAPTAQTVLGLGFFGGREVS